MTVRVLPSVVLVVLAVMLSACSGPDPAPGAPSSAAAGTAAAGSTTASTAPDPAAPSGTTTALPAPPQREPGPAGSGPAAAPAPAASSASPAPTADAHTDPGAVDVVVNKRRPLTPLDYAPAELRRPAVATPTAYDLLRPDAARAVEEMFAAAAADGVGLAMVSGYRSFADQESTYAYWVGQYGSPAGADTVSARPGYSEAATCLNSRESEFMQYRSLVGVWYASSNRWPRCEPHVAHSTSVRVIPRLRSVMSLTASGLIAA